MKRPTLRPLPGPGSAPNGAVWTGFLIIITLTIGALIESWQNRKIWAYAAALSFLILLGIVTWLYDHGKPPFGRKDRS
jgi:hypothetical protein